ncbi:ABC transporter substrate-binding protein [Lachnospiraceae bacterium CLA-AA-H215]|uniref:ABC transporter substrate-binding protein n=1 Tax=Hominifimenecus microfluidus TaxID=2885348 RepID=A0AAE3EAM9_9FIRM|nr:ABC transporter substrate-binding protein [Hominifimenecus microfluidus]MCC2231208.1 ABC transporter substrate-binding protein [Hominifimenecus microfluidus]
MKLNKVLAVVMAGAMTLSLAACGSSNSTADTTAAAGSAADTTAAAADASEDTADTTAAATEKSGELREMNVVLDWYPNALHTFIYTAIERGYYEEEGLDVHIQFPANDNDALALVAAGRAQIGLYYEHDIIQAVANQNVGIKSIGAVVQAPLNIILSLKDKNILSPKDLEGKTIGYSGTALSESLVYTMMQAVGASIDDVEMVNVGFELMSSMTTGNVDATIGCLVNHEVPELEHEGFEVNYFSVSDYGIPNYYEGVFLANNDMIENEPEVLEAFLRASAKGFKDFKADPYGCLDILLNNQNEENFPLTPEVEQQSCDTLLPLMETADAEFLSQTEENWQANIDWMLENGLIDHAVDVSDVMINLDWKK